MMVRRKDTITKFHEANNDMFRILDNYHHELMQKYTPIQHNISNKRNKSIKVQITGKGNTLN